MKLEAIIKAVTRHQYTDAFKTKAVSLGSKSGRLVAQMAPNLVILDNVLYRWGNGAVRTRAGDPRPRLRARSTTSWRGSSARTYSCVRSEIVYDVRRAALYMAALVATRRTR